MPNPPNRNSLAHSGETTLSGLVASDGFAVGPIFLAPDSSEAFYEPKETPFEELDVLRTAIAQASAETLEMMQSVKGDGADIIEFQLAMLEDDTFIKSSKEMLETGLPADDAWRLVLNAEIENYQASDDEYFAARSADLADIRDRVLTVLTGVKKERMPTGGIYLGEDISPSDFLAQDWSHGGGIVLTKGSASGHVAMLARQKGVPMLVRTIITEDVVYGSVALIDGVDGKITLNPEEETRQAFSEKMDAFVAQREKMQAYAAEPAVTASGTRIELLVNIADPEEIERIPIEHVDGVGLMRTEFLFGRGHGLPGETVQFEAYKKILKWAGDKPVTIRTVDAGGDKPVPGFTQAEDNPFLGVRGIRLCLHKPDIFAVQIRALLRAACHGNLKVMLPMVSHPDELDQARALFDREAELLAAGGVAHAMPPIGIMVEVPSVAITPARFEAAAFFSIGSNDLTQYVLAAARDNGALAELSKSDDPAVLSLVQTVASYGMDTNRDVSLCGDAASDPELIPQLLDCGLTTLSVAAARIGLAKSVIANYPMSGQAL